MAQNLFSGNDDTVLVRRTPETDESSTISSGPELGSVLHSPMPDTIGQQLAELYSDNITAKVFRASIDCLRNNVSLASASNITPE